MIRDQQRVHIGAQRYAAAGLECGVDMTTGRVVAEELRMRLVAVPVEDAKSRILDVYYCNNRENPYDTTPHR